MPQKWSHNIQTEQKSIFARAWEQLLFCNIYHRFLSKPSLKKKSSETQKTSKQQNKGPFHLF